MNMGIPKENNYDSVLSTRGNPPFSKKRRNPPFSKKPLLPRRREKAGNVYIFHMYMIRTSKHIHSILVVFDFRSSPGFSFARGDPDHPAREGRNDPLLGHAPGSVDPGATRENLESSRISGPVTSFGNLPSRVRFFSENFYRNPPLRRPENPQLKRLQAFDTRPKDCYS